MTDPARKVFGTRPERDTFGAAIAVPLAVAGLLAALGIGGAIALAASMRAVGNHELADKIDAWVEQAKSNVTDLAKVMMPFWTHADQEAIEDAAGSSAGAETGEEAGAEATTLEELEKKLAEAEAAGDAVAIDHIRRLIQSLTANGLGEHFAREYSHVKKGLDAAGIEISFSRTAEAQLEGMGLILSQDISLEWGHAASGDQGAAVSQIASEMGGKGPLDRCAWLRERLETIETRVRYLQNRTSLNPKAWPQGDLAVVPWEGGGAFVVRAYVAAIESLMNYYGCGGGAAPGTA